MFFIGNYMLNFLAFGTLRLLPSCDSQRGVAAGTLVYIGLPPPRRQEIMLKWKPVLEKKLDLQKPRIY